MTEKEAMDILQDISGIRYSDEQKKILLSKGGTRILACAGAGKTMVLTHLIAKRILTGEIENPKKILCTTYSKEGVSEMSDRLNFLLKKARTDERVTVTTIHAFYHRLLRRFGYTYNICTERLQYITRAIRELNLKLTEDDIGLVDSLISYQLNNMLLDAELYNDSAFSLNITLDEYKEIKRLYTNYKKETNSLDFDDLQGVVYKFLCCSNTKNVDMIDYCRKNWEYYFIDEYQDVSKIQYAIFQAIINHTDNLVVIGDDDQSIYSWRGADPRIILSVGVDYNLHSYVLSTNYRSGGEIVRRAAVQISNNVVRTKKQIKPHVNKGEIKVCLTTPDLYTESKQAYNYIVDLIDMGVSPEDIAVIARNNNHLSILSSLLFRSNIFCVLRDEIKITNTVLYKDIKTVIELVDGCYNSAVAQRILWKLISFLGKKGSKIIADIMYMTGNDLVTSIGYALDRYSFRYRGKLASVGLSKEIDEKFRNSFNSVVKDRMEVELFDLYTILAGDDEVKKCKDLLALYAKGCSFIYNTEDKQRILHSYIEYISDLVMEGYDIVLTYMNLLEQFESGEMKINEPRVTLTTAHSAKGKEWKYVVLLADDNITFPSFDGFNGLLRKDRKNAFNSLSEERRLHYVAMTRAKEELLVICDKYNPSVFLLEAFEADLGDIKIEQLSKRCVRLDTSPLNKAKKVYLDTKVARRARKLE